MQSIEVCHLVIHAVAGTFADVPATRSFMNCETTAKSRSNAAIADIDALLVDDIRFIEGCSSFPRPSESTVWIGING